MKKMLLLFILVLAGCQQLRVNQFEEENKKLQQKIEILAAKLETVSANLKECANKEEIKCPPAPKPKVVRCPQDDCCTDMLTCKELLVSAKEMLDKKKEELQEKDDLLADCEAELQVKSATEKELEQCKEDFDTCTMFVKNCAKLLKECKKKSEEFDPTKPYMIPLCDSKW